MGNSASVLELMLDPENLEIARSNFKKYDADENGKIDKEEFTKFISDLWDAFDKNWTEKDTKENSETYKALSNFDTYDKDKNGDISFDEFVETVKEYKFAL